MPKNGLAKFFRQNTTKSNDSISQLASKPSTKLAETKLVETKTEKKTAFLSVTNNKTVPYSTVTESLCEKAKPSESQLSQTSQPSQPSQPSSSQSSRSNQSSQSSQGPSHNHVYDLFQQYHQKKPSVSTDHLIPSDHVLFDTPANYQRRYAVKKAVCEAYGLPQVKFLHPAGQIHVLDMSHLEFIKDHVSNVTISEKADGVRYWLVLTRYNAQQNVAVMLTHNYTMYEVGVIAPESAFNGSVFEGELVWEFEHNRFSAPRQVFLVYDILSFEGHSLVQGSFHQRQALVLKTIGNGEVDLVSNPRDWLTIASQQARKQMVVCEGNVHALTFRAKPTHSFDTLETIWKNTIHLKFYQDGLIINDDLTKKIYKWKPQPTVDVWCCLDGHTFTKSITSNNQTSSSSSTNLTGTATHTGPGVNVVSSSSLAPFVLTQIYYEDDKTHELKNAGLYGISVEDPSHSDHSHKQARTIPMILMPSLHLKQTMDYFQSQKNKISHSSQMNQTNQHHQINQINEMDSTKPILLIAECRCKLPELNDFIDDAITPVVELTLTRWRWDKHSANTESEIVQVLKQVAQPLSIKHLLG